MDQYSSFLLAQQFLLIDKLSDVSKFKMWIVEGVPDPGRGWHEVIFKLPLNPKISRTLPVLSLPS